MKNVQTFNEFVNESESINEAYYTLLDIMKDAPEDYDEERSYVWEPIMRLMKIKNPNYFGIISSDDEGEPEYDIFLAIKDKIRPGKSMNLSPDANYYYDRKLNVVHAEAQGHDAYFFNTKDAKKLLR